MVSIRSQKVSNKVLFVINTCRCSGGFWVTLIPDRGLRVGISPLWWSCRIQTGVKRSGWVPDWGWVGSTREQLRGSRCQAFSSCCGSRQVSVASSSTFSTLLLGCGSVGLEVRDEELYCLAALRGRIFSLSPTQKKKTLL